MPEIDMIFARKIFSQFFFSGGGGANAPSPTAMNFVSCRLCRYILASGGLQIPTRALPICPSLGYTLSAPHLQTPTTPPFESYLLCQNVDNADVAKHH